MNPSPSNPNKQSPDTSDLDTTIDQGKHKFYEKFNEKLMDTNNSDLK